MAIPRSSLTALDGYDDSIDWGAISARATGRILRALPGGTLLAAHLAIFGTVLVGAFGWALIDHPTDLSSLEAFRLWGAIVAMHVVVTGIYQLVARVLGWTEPNFVTTSLPVQRRVESPARPAVLASILTSGGNGNTRVNSTARRWAATSTRTVSIHREVTTSGDWPPQPAILTSDEREDVGEVTWPTTAPISTMLNASGGATNPSDELVSIDPAAAQATGGTQTWVDGFVESQTRAKEQRWSWVEAAAASWLSRRDTSTPEASESVADTDEFLQVDSEAPTSGPDSTTGA